MRVLLPTFHLLLLGCLLVGCAVDGPGGGLRSFGRLDGKADGTPQRFELRLLAGEAESFSLQAAGFRATFEQGGDIEVGLAARSGEREHASELVARPTLEVTGDGTLRDWTLRVFNMGEAPLVGVLIVVPTASIDGPAGTPSTASPVQYENEWCVYQDTMPYVAEVHWDHPLVKAATAALAPGWRSTFSYQDWRKPYGLENHRNATTDAERAAMLSRNYVRVLCGEHRDTPEVIGQKLSHLAHNHVYAGADELREVDTDANLFNQLTFPAYERLVAAMGAVYTYKRSLLSSNRDGYNYGLGEHHEDSNRVERSVAPWTHCEMKFLFENYLVAGAPQVHGPSYMAEYERYRRRQCSDDDLAWMYNFRGHVNHQPLWLESNGLILNSRRARGAAISRGLDDYYKRPVATRLSETRKALGAYLFHSEADHEQMVDASVEGGGPILYITDQDADGNGIADYRLFEQRGCGDQGVSIPVPSQNCNMVSWEEAWATPSTLGHAAAWNPAWHGSPDMGFMRAFPGFEQRMSRINQAFDRHTNWGPTGFYMLGASDEGDDSPRFNPVYSPVVAASYDVSASDFFVRRDYDSTDPFEKEQAKWLYVMRFRAEHYYDERSLADGAPMDFMRHYFNETSLSNDFYVERALNHFFFIPAEEAYSNVYLTYGQRGVEAERYEVGAP